MKSKKNLSISSLAESPSARILSLILIAAMLMSVANLSTTAYAAAQQRTWTGNNPPSTLSGPSNWVGSVAPVAGDDLFFPAGVRRKSIRNNYPNQTTFNSLNFSSSGYNLKKNSLTLTGGINTSNPTGTNQISLPLYLNDPQSFVSGNVGTVLALNGQLNLDTSLLIAGAGNTAGNGLVRGSGGITKLGSGTLTLAANNTYTGATTMTAGTLRVNGSQSSSGVTLTGGIFGGTGTVGTITAVGGAIRPGTSAPGILNSRDVTLSGTTSFVGDLNGTTPGSGYRQLNVTGTVSLGSSLLDTSLNFASAVGNTFTLINNDGVDPVIGTFLGLPEATTLTLGALPFTISYQGGTGNDVVLTRIISTGPTPPAISVNDVIASEGDTGSTQAVFTLSLSAASSQTVTVNYATADGTATAPDDYTSVAGIATFNPGETTKTIAVSVNGDTVHEVDETFLFDLRSSTNASITDGQGQGTILNDDALPAVSIGDVSVTEGNSGEIEAIFSVTLSAQSGQTVTVNYATANGTATEHPGNDYEGGSGLLTFAPGETDDEVIVFVNGDTAVEANETFFVNLTSQTNSTIADAQGLGTIIDDDATTPSPTPTPDPSPTPTPDPSPTPSPTLNTVQFSDANYSVDEGAGSITITVTRSGDTFASASVEYATFDSIALERPDYTTSLGTLRFAPGETSQSFVVFITDDTYVEENELLTLSLSNPKGVGLGGQSTVNLTVMDNDSAPSLLNPADAAMFFVRQHYVDFLNREPDTSGFDFWTNQLNACGSEANCVAERRVNVSAAYFLSIEFQQTGYLIYLTQKASFGNMPRYREFLRDTQEIGKGVIVGEQGWEAVLEANKHAFMDNWVNRDEFRVMYEARSDADFVNTLFDNAGVADAPARDSLVAGLQAGTETRSSVLLKVTGNQSFSQKEFNSAFVLMQYFGYLRRNPNDAPDNNLDGFNFWLGKLNQHNGNFVDAEMVKAFISATEYRQRFGQP